MAVNIIVTLAVMAIVGCAWFAALFNLKADWEADEADERRRQVRESTYRIEADLDSAYETLKRINTDDARFAETKQEWIKRTFGDS